MQVGTIEWNTVDLSLIGKPRLMIRSAPDPAPPSQATRQMVTLIVTVELEALDPSTLQARLEYLQRSMQVPEGILKSLSPGGHTLEWTATPNGNSLGEPITGLRNSVEMSFSAIENFRSDAMATLIDARYTPFGSTDSIILHAIRDYHTTISTDRHSPLASARRLTTTTITFTARVMQTNPADSPATRMTLLLAKQEQMRALNTSSGSLAHCGLTQIVQVQSITPQIDEARMALDLAIQCFHVHFPDDDKAECALEISSREDEGASETITSISGTIEARSQAIALAKLQTIITRHLVGNRRLANIQKSLSHTDGADTQLAGMEAEGWAGSMKFTIELREISGDSTRWTLKATTSQNVRNIQRYSYTGSVKASTAEIALAKARVLGASQPHPFRVSSEETIDTNSAPGSDVSQFVMVTYSYEYEGPAVGFLFAEISSDRNTSLFGDWRIAVSGNITAPDTAQARSFLASLLSSYSSQRAIEISERESEQSLSLIGSTNVRMAMRLEFSRSYPVMHTFVAAKYSDDSSVDYASMTQTRTISGSLWTNTRENSEVALSSLITSVFGEVPVQRLRKGHAIESWAPEGTFTTLPTQRWIQLDFSAECITKITGSVGFDIIEAKCSITRNGSISKTVIHEIPMDYPIAQTGVTYTIATVQISATCKARTQDAARAWCQNLRALLTNIGSEGVTRHETSPPQESISPDYAPFLASGGSPTVFVFSATYSYGFSGNISQNSSIWPSGYVAL